MACAAFSAAAVNTFARKLPMAIPPIPALMPSPIFLPLDFVSTPSSSFLMVDWAPFRDGTIFT